MIILGLLLMLACTALAVDAVVENADTVNALAFTQNVSDLTLGGVFVAGAVVGLLFALGLAMLTGGLGRARRRRRALRSESAEAAALREHNSRLEAQLAEERSSTAAYPSDSESTATRNTGGRHRIER